VSTRPSHRRASVSGRLSVAAFCLLATLGALDACLCPAAGATSSQDWRHTLQVVADLRAAPPAEPLVILLGGSAARECIGSDARWAAQVRRLGGPVIVARDLGSRNQTFAQDLKLVDKLPDIPTVVFIGVGPDRFAQAPSDPAVSLPEPSPIPADYNPHQYRSAHVLSAVRKRQLVRDWLARRSPLFKKHYSYNLAVLRRLVAACRAKGFYPVLLDLPRDAAVIRHALDRPLTRYHDACETLAARRHIPFLNFVRAARLADRDFYDLWHLVEPGRVKWQRLLSLRTVDQLAKHDLGATGS
jgi:hypothetical protein